MKLGCGTVGDSGVTGQWQAARSSLLALAGLGGVSDTGSLVGCQSDTTPLLALGTLQLLLGKRQNSIIVANTKSTRNLKVETAAARAMGGLTVTMTLKCAWCSARLSRLVDAIDIISNVGIHVSVGIIARLPYQGASMVRCVRCVWSLVNREVTRTLVSVGVPPVDAELTLKVA